MVLKNLQVNKFYAADALKAAEASEEADSLASNEKKSSPAKARGAAELSRSAVFARLLKYHLKNGIVYSLIIYIIMLLAQILPFILDLGDSLGELARINIFGTSEGFNGAFLLSMQNLLLSPFIILATAFLVYSIYEHYNDKAASDFFYSIPVSRIAENGARISAVMILQLIPFALHALTMLLYFKSISHHFDASFGVSPAVAYMPYFFDLLIASLAYSAYSMIFAAFAGKASDVIKLNIIFQAAGALISQSYYIAERYIDLPSPDAQSIDFINNFSTEFMQFATPLTNLFRVETFDKSDKILSWPVLLVTLLSALFFLKKKPAEYAESKLLNLPASKAVFLLGGLIGATAVTLHFDLLYNNPFTGYAVGILAAYPVAHFYCNGDVKEFFNRKNFIYLLIGSAYILIMLLIGLWQ